MKINIFFTTFIFLIFVPNIGIGNAFYSNLINSSTAITSFSSLNEFNPATLTSDYNNQLNLKYIPSRLGVQDLNYNSIYGKFAINDKFAVGIRTGGIFNSLFNDYTVAAAISGNLNQILNLGLEFEYNSYSVKDFSTSSQLWVNLGGKLKIDESVYAAFILRNTFRNYRSSGIINPEQTAQIGFGVAPLDNFYIDIDAVINIAKSSAALVAAKYDLEKFMSMRIAYLSNPQLVSAGISIKLTGNYFMEYILSKYNDFEYEHCIGVSFIWR